MPDAGRTLPIGECISLPEYFDVPVVRMRVTSTRRPVIGCTLLLRR